MLHKIKFNNDDIFEFIPCSLINIDTSEVYINEYAEKNLINLSYLKSNDKLNIKFNLKINFANLQEKAIKSTIKFFPYEKFNNITTVKNCITFKQSLLKINTNPDKSLITVENIGTSPIKNIIFRYAIPTRYEVNLGSLSAIFNNNDKWNLIAEKIDSNIIFKISFLPQSNNIPEINIQLSNVDSSLSINDK